MVIHFRRNGGMTEDVNKQRRKDTIDKIEGQIDRVEEIVNKLLENIKMEEIEPLDKLNVAIKFMAQHSRLIALKNSVEIDEPVGRETMLFTVLQKHLRGEKPEGIDG